MPNVHDRQDAAAEALTETVDPHAVLASLEARLEEAQKTDASTVIVTEEIDSAAVEREQAIRQAQDAAPKKE